MVKTLLVINIYIEHADVDDFKTVGTISKNDKGDIKYSIDYIWNDKIDPNFSYCSDSQKAEFAKKIPFVIPKDYIIRINDITIPQSRKNKSFSIGIRGG